MQKLTNWSARRAGSGMTITGTDETGAIRKVTQVDRIEAALPHPIAHQGERAQFQLVSA